MVMEDYVREHRRGSRQATAAATWQRAVHGHERAGSPRHLSDPAGDAVCGGLDGIVGEVGVARGGLHLGVPEQFADHGQAFADQKTTAGKAVAQIVDSHIVEPGPCANAPPGVLQVGEMAPRLATRDHPRVVVLSLDAAQHRDRGVAQMHHLGACLGIREPELASVQVDMLPTQLLDLRQPAPGQHQQPNGGDRRRRLGTVRLDVPQRCAQAPVLFVGQEALALLFLEPLHVPARVRSIRPQLPQLCEVENLRQHSERPVGLIRRLAYLVMEGRNVAPLNVRHPAACQSSDR